jgi:hypothetical protein
MSSWARSQDCVSDQIEQDLPEALLVAAASEQVSRQLHFQL